MDFSVCIPCVNTSLPVFPSPRHRLPSPTSILSGSKTCFASARCIEMSRGVAIHDDRRGHAGIRARGGNGTRVPERRRVRVRVIIDRAAPHSARFGDPLAVDNAYSLLTYIVIDARSRPRDLFSMHRNIRSTDFAPPAKYRKIARRETIRTGAVTQ